MTACELVHSGRKPEDLARGFEPSAQTIRNWVAQADLNDVTRRLNQRPRTTLGFKTPADIFSSDVALTD